MYSASSFGRSARSIASSCGTAAGAIRRSVSIMRRYPRSTLMLTTECVDSGLCLSRNSGHGLRYRRHRLVEALHDHAAYLEHRVHEIALADRRHGEAHALRAFVHVEAHVTVFGIEGFLHDGTLCFGAGDVVHHLPAESERALHLDR